MNGDARNVGFDDPRRPDTCPPVPDGLGATPGCGPVGDQCRRSRSREPGLRTLTKLIEATGHRLSIDVVPRERRQLGLSDTRLGRRLRRRRRAIIDIAAHRGARNVRVFGSVARGDDDAASDIDLLIDLDDGVGLVALAALERELGELLGTGVDVVPATTLKHRIREEVLAEAIPL